MPAAGVPTAPAMPQDVQALLDRLRLPHIRRHASEVIATAKAQRWEPVKVLRALLVVVCGPAGTGKTFLLEALGQHAVEQGPRVAWFTLEYLGILART